MEELFQLQILTNIWELQLAGFLYLVYIRPIFEYACEVWDNCLVGNSNKLDQLQLRLLIVTGLPIFASSILIYKESGCESLAERKGKNYKNVL